MRVKRNNYQLASPSPSGAYRGEHEAYLDRHGDTSGFVGHRTAPECPRSQWTVSAPHGKQPYSFRPVEIGQRPGSPGVQRPKRRSVRIPNPAYGPDDPRKTLVRKVS